jgi:serine/threonine protein kinase
MSAFDSGVPSSAGASVSTSDDDRGRASKRGGSVGRGQFLSPEDFPSLSEFTQAPANLSAVDSVLDAACALGGFEMAEVWTHMSEVARDQNDKVTGVTRRPICLHLYAMPQSIYGYEDIEKGALSDGQRHSLSPMLVDEAQELTEPLWLTSTGPESYVHNDLPLNTAVAIPVSVATLRHDIVVVFFSMEDRKRQEWCLEILKLLSMAASTACSKRFPAFAANSKDAVPESLEVHTTPDAVEAMKRLSMTTSCATLNVQPQLDMKWHDLHDVEFLVNGSRCTIYTAFTAKELPVVVKVVRKDAPDKDVVKQELAFETDILQRVTHPNIVKLVGAGHKPEKFMVIERLDGGTLAQRCGNALAIRDRRRRFRQRRPFSYRQLLKCSKQMAEALKYMHSDAIPGHMVIHRDLKPDNVGFDSDGNLKLLDLGLSRVIKKEGHLNTLYKMTGETGSLRYMAPEVAQRRPYNQKADVYSFGMILWEMGSMKKPYDGMGREEFYAQVVHGGMLPPLDRRWPSDFVQLLQTCWRPDPAERPDFDAIVQSLDRMIGAFAEQAQRELPEQHVSKNKGLLGWLRKHSHSRPTSQGTPSPHG